MVIDYEGSWALMYADLSFRAMKKYATTALGLTNTCTVSIGENRYYKVYIDESDLKENQEKMFAFLYDSVRVKQCTQDIMKLIEEMENYQNSKGQMSDIELFKWYCDLCEKYLLHYNTISCGGLYENVWNYLSDIVPQTYQFAVEEIRNALIASNSQSLLTYRELESWIILCEKHLDGMLNDKDIEKHRSRFRALHSSTNGKKHFTNEILKQQIREITFRELEVLKIRYKNIQTISERNEEWAEQTFERMSDNYRDYEFIRNVSVFPVLRLMMREAYQRLKMYALDSFLELIVCKINDEFGFDAFDYLMVDEIKDYLTDSVLPDMAIIMERRNRADFIYKDGCIYFNATDNILARSETLHNHQNIVIKGTPVFGTGIKKFKTKKIIQDAVGEDELWELQKSEDISKLVLVTNTIRPYMIQLCMQLGALILTEGGITSHASVLCRELGIPCLVGVENANTILEDGQYVQIDFAKGIVKVTDEHFGEDVQHVFNRLIEFTDEDAANLHIVGGKAFNLHKIADKVRIPQGFVISTIGTGILISSDKQKYDVLKNSIERRIEKLNVNSLAIRSSHDEEDGRRQTLAGVFESYTNVPAGNRLLVMKNIIDVINSAERIKSGGAKQMAVIVQEMISADVSGVIITSKPFRGYDYMMVEYIWGDLENLMQGEVQPFRTYVKKVNLFDGDCLSGVCLPALVDVEHKCAFDELGRMALEIEKHFLMPVEIEWGISNGIPYIFQARPY